MKLTVFQAGKGDCVLLTASDGTQVLVDGGMRNAYRTHVAPALAGLAAANTPLELVYVSHIDQDHISGVLQLMDDTVAWRVFDFQRSRGNAHVREPKRPRPPAINNLWHNAFDEQVEEHPAEIEDLLAARAAVIEASDRADLDGEAERHRELATSVAEGIELSRRVSPAQLGIALNQHFAGKLAFAREGQAPIQIGSLTINVIGPFPEDLDNLREEWDAWLEKERDHHERLKRRMQRDVDRLATNEIDLLREPLELAAGALGDRSEVTAPNLASLMLLVEEDGAALLLTGDGHAREVLRGLERVGKLNERGGFHADVFKVQHHGAEFNLDADFARLVSADTYVFSANGEHANPDPRIVQALIDSRLGPDSARNRNPEAARPFEFRFNSSSHAAPRAKERAHMLGIETLVQEAAAQSGGRMTFSFLDDSSFELDVA